MHTGTHTHIDTPTLCRSLFLHRRRVRPWQCHRHQPVDASCPPPDAACPAAAASSLAPSQTTGLPACSSPPALLGRLVVSLETSHLLQARDTWVSSDRKLHRHSRCCKHRHLIQILLSQGAYRSSRVKNKYSATCRGNDLSAILRTSSLCGSADKLFRSSQRAGTQCWCDTASVCIVKTTQRVAHPHCL